MNRLLFKISLRALLIPNFAKMETAVAFILSDNALNAFVPHHILRNGKQSLVIICSTPMRVLWKRNNITLRPSRSESFTFSPKALL